MSRDIAYVDTETTGTNVWTGARPFAVSARIGGETLYWEWTVDPETRKPYLVAADLREIRKIVSSRRIEKAFYNATFDRLMLESIGVENRGPYHEVQYKVRACYSSELTFELKPICEKYLDIPKGDQDALQRAVVKARRVARKLGWAIASQETHGKDHVKADYWTPETLWRLEPKLAKAADIPRGLCQRYAERDAVRTEKLDELFEFGMDDFGVRGQYEFEMSIHPYVERMQRRGVRVDEERIAEMEAQCAREHAAAVALVREAAGDPKFNLHSHKQLTWLLYDKLGLECVKRTKVRYNAKGKQTGGAPSTDAEALMPHKAHPVVRGVLTAKANLNAKDNFFGKYRRLAVREGRDLILHPSIQQWGTLTTRFTMKDPNLQQVSDPTNTSSKSAEFVVDVRQAFVPRRDCVWYCFDYSQVEVIIFAAVAGVETMLEAIRSGADIHSAVAERIWGGEGNPRAVRQVLNLLRPNVNVDKLDGGEVTEAFLGGCDDPTEEWAVDLLDLVEWRITALEAALGLKVLRKRSKASTFTKIFGGKEGALMGWLGLTKPEARVVLVEYDDVFPEIEECASKFVSQAYKQGFITNSFGVRIQVDRNAAYKAMNYAVQSDAAQLMKRGFKKVARYLDDLGAGELLLSIHDELIMEISRKAVRKPILREVKRLMSDNEGAFCVETPVDCERVRERWSVKEKVKL